jgi:hypothetical protein
LQKASKIVIRKGPENTHLPKVEPFRSQVFGDKMLCLSRFVENGLKKKRNTTPHIAPAFRAKSARLNLSISRYSRIQIADQQPPKPTFADRGRVTISRPFGWLGT